MKNTVHTMDDMEERRRKEIINGKVVMMSPARLNHVRVAGNIYYFFRKNLEGKTCQTFPDGTMIYLEEENQFVPDVTVVCDPDKIGGTKINGAPDLVVEVLSPSTTNNDRIHKKKVYEKYGVREYWTVNVEARSVDIYVLENGVLELEHIYTAYPAYLTDDLDEVEKAEFMVDGFHPAIFPDFFITLEEIFKDVK